MMLLRSTASRSPKLQRILSSLRSSKLTSIDILQSTNHQLVEKKRVDTDMRIWPMINTKKLDTSKVFFKIKNSTMLRPERINQRRRKRRMKVERLNKRMMMRTSKLIELILLDSV